MSTLTGVAASQAIGHVLGGGFVGSGFDDEAERIAKRLPEQTAGEHVAHRVGHASRRAQASRSSRTVRRRVSGARGF